MNNQNDYIFIYTWYKIKNKQILPTIAKPITNAKAYQIKLNNTLIGTLNTQIECFNLWKNLHEILKT